MNIPMQAEVVKELLSTESITVIGLLLGICGLLIYNAVRKEKLYEELFKKYISEQELNKDVLIKLVEKSILANEKNIYAINRSVEQSEDAIKIIKNVYSSK
jgi:hypothetical protein